MFTKKVEAQNAMETTGQNCLQQGGHTGLFLEIPYETLESGGLLNVEKDRKKIGYPCLKEK